MSYPADISQTLEQRVYRIVEEVLTDPSLFIVDVQVRGVRGSRAVDVYLDSDKNLDVSTLAELSRQIGFLLDTEDVIDGKYQLNVSSPGLDRPLKLVRQYNKNIGRTLKVIYNTNEKRTTLKGELVRVEDGFIEIAKSRDQVQRVFFDEIIESKVVLPW